MSRVVPFLYRCGHTEWMDKGSEPEKRDHCTDCEREYQENRPRQTRLFDNERKPPCNPRLYD